MGNINDETLVVPDETTIQQRIYLIRGTRIMIDSDLAELYQIETKHLKRQVRRNLSRFPSDFMFELNDAEKSDLRCQNGTSNKRGGNRYSVFAFTELGVAMLSSVLTSEVAVHVNIAIMRAFAAFKDYLSKQSRINAEIEELRAKVNLLFQERESDLENMNDLSEDIRSEIAIINQAIAELSLSINKQEEPARTKIGFKTGLVGQ